MSRVNRAHARLQAQVMQEMLGLSCDASLSARLQQATAELAGTGSLQHVQPVLREPGIAELAAQIGQGARLEAALAATQPGATLTDATVQLLTDVDDRLGRLQQRAVTSLVQSVFQQQGWTVQTEEGEVASGIEASRGDETLLVAVMGHSELLVDQVGAGDCHGNLANLMAGMEQAGAPLTLVAEIEHDPNGGPLIAQAAAAGEPNLAAGIARHALRGLANQSTRTPAERRTQTGTVVRLGG